MTTWEIYWLLKLDNLHDLAFTLLFIMFFVAGGFCIVSIFTGLAGSDYDMREKDRIFHENISKKTKPWAISLVVLWLAFLVAKSLLPTTAQMAAITVIPPIVNNEKVRQVPEKVLDLLNTKLDQLRKDITKEK